MAAGSSGREATRHSSSTNSTEADALSVGEKEELAELEVAIADKLQWHSTLLPFVWADPAAIAFPVVEARTGRSTVPAAYIVARLDPEALKDILAEAVTRYFYDEGERVVRGGGYRWGPAHGIRFTRNRR